jgi:hypothetical protein
MAATCTVIGLLGGFAAAVPASTSFVSLTRRSSLYPPRKTSDTMIVVTAELGWPWEGPA